MPMQLRMSKCLSKTAGTKQWYFRHRMQFNEQLVQACVKYQKPLWAEFFSCLWTICSQRLPANLRRACRHLRCIEPQAYRYCPWYPASNSKAFWTLCTQCNCSPLSWCFGAVRLCCDRKLLRAFWLRPRRGFVIWAKKSFSLSYFLVLQRVAQFDLGSMAHRTVHGSQNESFAILSFSWHVTTRRSAQIYAPSSFGILKARCNS